MVGVISIYYISQSHPVDQESLNDILSAFSENERNKISRKLLIFVTPEVGNYVSSIQNITTCNSESNAEINAQEFIQCVIKIQFN